MDDNTVTKLDSTLQAMADATRAFLNAHPEYGDSKLVLYDHDDGLKCHFTMSQTPAFAEAFKRGAADYEAGKSRVAPSEICGTHLGYCWLRGWDDAERRAQVGEYCARTDDECPF